MNEDQKKNDPIVSIFHQTTDDEKLDKDAVRSWLETQPQNDEDIRNCETLLKIYADLLKTEFYMDKSWDIQTLTKSVLVKFELENSDPASSINNNNTETFYKDIALKCIKDCDRLSGRLQKYEKSSNAIRSYILSAQSRILQDSLTCLLEIWFTCNKELCLLKNKIAGLFIRSKVLLIDYELESLKFQLSDTTIISSYRSFMKILIEQLRDSEVSRDQAMFDECLQVFLDIEAMYNALNFNWLLTENTFLQDSLPLSPQGARPENHFDDNELDSLTPYSMESLTEHSRSSSMSGSTDFSLMMERTNLSKELPSLLTAFNNAKRLEQEIENVRITPASSQISSSIPHHQQHFLPSTNQFKAKLMMMKQQQNNLNHFNPPAHNLKSMSKSSDILNNLHAMNNGSNRN